MSWATCYSGSNNIHFNYPPIMGDGRNFASWQPGAKINQEIRANANITSNWDYRKYLMKNADSIIKINQIESCNNCGCCPPASHNNTNDQMIGPKQSNTPYVFQSCTSRDQPFGYENSDLKHLYLSREQLKIMKADPVSFRVAN